MAKKIEYENYQEKILNIIHGVEGDGVGLRAEIEHRIVFPKRQPNTAQMIVVFYCDRTRLDNLIKSAAVHFGDSDITKSISRYLTAGFHYMEKSEDTRLVMECVARQKKVELDIRCFEEEVEAYKEEYGAVLDEHHARRQDIIRFRNDIKGLVEVKHLQNHKESLELNISIHKKTLAIFKHNLETETPTKELIQVICSRLISKLVPKWMLRK